MAAGASGEYLRMDTAKDARGKSVNGTPTSLPSCSIFLLPYYLSTCLTTSPVCIRQADPVQLIRHDRFEPMLCLYAGYGMWTRIPIRK